MVRHHPRDVRSIVDEQVLRSAVQVEPVTETDNVWPVVTISREFGTRGQAVGLRVARQLGFSAWDRELVQTVAERLHTSEFALSEFDERHRGALEDFFSSVWREDSLSVRYGELLRGLVKTIVRRGRAVIVGRGAQFLVDPEASLRVRLVAPFHERVRSYEEQLNLTHEGAETMVRAGDKERVEYVRKEFGKDESDPTSYDLLINVSTYPPERSDALILMAYLAKFGSLPEGAHIAEDSEPRRYPVSEAPGPPDRAEEPGAHI